MIKILKRIFSREHREQSSPTSTLYPGLPPDMLFQDQDSEKFRDDLRVVKGSDDATFVRTQKTAERKVLSAAEQSLKRLHILQRGRCPECGDALRQHLFASVCESCGWSSWSTPWSGGVKLHLSGGEVIDGDIAYVIKDGVVVLLRGEVVLGRFSPGSIAWIEYLWKESELKDRERMLRDRMSLSCGWCGKETDPGKDGFRLVQTAFGTTQERYCFCSDDCYEAFRKMYPSRIHRNCYERDCEGCDLCIKRYRDEASGMRTILKDFLSVSNSKKSEGK